MDYQEGLGISSVDKGPMFTDFRHASFLAC